MLVIFDLDGTLVNTSPGIFNSVRYTEKQMGLTPIPDSDLRKFVGPPLKPNYMEIFGLNEKDAATATNYHKDYGRTKGFLEVEIYEGIESLLDHIKGKGYSLAVATLKNEKTAIKVLDHVGIANRFDIIVGQDDNEGRTKAETIDIAMKATNNEKAVLIGDSIYDYNGAKAAGVDFIGVTYGFGFEPEREYDFKTSTSTAIPEILPLIESFT